jgi:hypothetical protein
MIILNDILHVWYAIGLSIIILQLYRIAKAVGKVPPAQDFKDFKDFPVPVLAEPPHRDERSEALESTVKIREGSTESLDSSGGENDSEGQDSGPPIKTILRASGAPRRAIRRHYDALTMRFVEKGRK